jgi:probable F420-dependent oxidoreductase
MATFSVAIPQGAPGGAFDPVATRRFLQRAEALGFDGAWTHELVLGASPNLGPLELLGFAAACTERMRLGCSVLVASVHSPVHLAKSLGTLDQLSAGRLDVGVGTGGPTQRFAAFGVDGSSYVARFNEVLEVVRRLWAEERVDLDGRFVQLAGAAMEPKPVQRPGPPIWYGGAHPAAVRRAARDGDGFFGAGAQTTAQFAEQVVALRAHLAELGRDPAGFGIAKRVYVVIDDDIERARARVSAGLGALYSAFRSPDLVDVAVYGPPGACADGLAAVVAAGAGMVLVNAVDDADEQLERLAAEVLPALR